MKNSKLTEGQKVVINASAQKVYRGQKGIVLFKRGHGSGTYYCVSVDLVGECYFRRHELESI